MKKIPTTYKSNTIRHLTKTKIFVKDGNVVYNDETNKSEMYTYQYNIPYANISILSLGHGTSITEQAIKKLSETDTLIVFMSINYKISSIIYPNNNRNAKYIIPWFNKINNEKNRLDLAKKMLNLRIQYNESLKFGDIEPVLKKLSFIEVQITNFNDATSIEEVLGHEGSYTKNLYKKTATFFRQTEFKKNGESLINKRLNIVNSMIYSLASLTLHSLNINTCLSVLHGRTNQDSLVYDLADLFKGLLLPYAFLYSIEKQMKYFIKDDQEFRMKIIEIIEKENLLNQMFKTMIELTDA